MPRCIQNIHDKLLLASARLAKKHKTLETGESHANCDKRERVVF